MNRVNTLYPEDIDNDELNSLLTTTKNLGDDIDMKDKEIVRLKAKVEKMQETEDKLKIKVERAKKAKAVAKTSATKAVVTKTPASTNR